MHTSIYIHIYIYIYKAISVLLTYFNKQNSEVRYEQTNASDEIFCLFSLSSRLQPSCKLSRTFLQITPIQQIRQNTLLFFLISIYIYIYMYKDRYTLHIHCAFIYVYIYIYIYIYTYTYVYTYIYV